MTTTPSGIIVLHGALGSVAQMAPVVEALGAIAPVRALEFPGHGVTPRGPVPFTIEGFATWLSRAIGGGPPTPLVFGYSMGGYVALTLEARHASAAAVTPTTPWARPRRVSTRR